MAAAGDRKGVDHAFEQDLGTAADGKRVIEEAEVELGSVRHERRIAEKVDDLLDVLVEASLVGKKGIAEPVNLFSRKRHRPVGIEIGMEGAPGGYPVDQLDA